MRFRAFGLLLLLVLSHAAFGQATFTPVDLGFPHIVVGGDADGLNYTTLLQVVNNNSATITAHVALFTDSGSALAVLFDGTGPQSTADLTFAAGESRQIRLTLSGTITQGWMRITYSPSEAATSVILQYRSGTTLLSEVGVDPAVSIGSTDFAAETDVTINTGIAISNPTTATAFVLARLSDPGTGSTASSTVITVPANGHIARLLTELFSSVLTISQIRAKVSLDVCSSATCTVAGLNGVLATAIRLNADQFTTIPVIARTSSGDQVRILPHVAFGGSTTGLNFKTVLYFTTNVSSGVFGTADIFDNDGNPLAASADGAAPSSSITFTVPGNRVSRIVLSGDQITRSGWIRLTLPGTLHLITNAIFQTFNGTTLAAEASVLESAPVNTGLVPVKVVAGAANVGVAFASSQADSNTITLTLFNRDGFVAGNRDITLPPNGHLAQFVTEIFPQLASLADFDGAVSMHSSAAFSALALRLTTDKLATLPVAENGMYRPSVTGLRITKTQRAGAQVSFQVDTSDFDSDLATSSATTVVAIACIDIQATNLECGYVNIDGTSVVNKLVGTLSATFIPPDLTTQTAPSGFSSVLYIVVYDSTGNQSNIVTLPFKF
jgi:hypothetical protein